MRADFKTTKEKFDVALEDYVDTTTKVPVVVLGDISESMSWHNGLDGLQKGLDVFIKTLNDDEYAKATVEVSVFTFNHETTKIIDFLPVDQISIPPLVASGGTDISKAIFTALDTIDSQIEIYKSKKIKYKAPWLVLLSDSDIPLSSDIDDAVDETTKRILDNKLTMFCFGCGDEVNTKDFNRFNPKMPVLRTFKSEDIVILFEWLSQTTKRYTQSGDGETVKSEPIDRRIEIVG